MKIRELAARHGIDLGCSDSGCVFGAPKGMHTNGGCRCFESRMLEIDRGTPYEGALKLSASREMNRKMLKLLRAIADATVSPSASTRKKG